jgi:hypothetical protein
MHCTNPSPWHMQQFIHLDEVKSRHAASLQMPTADCILKPENVHTAARLQTPSDGPKRLPVCSFPFDCKLLAIPGHADKYMHLCPEGTKCEDFTLDHRRQWLHADDPPVPCPDGLQCPLSDDINHILQYSHPCPAGVQCNKLMRVHLECFTHDIPMCSAGSRCWRTKFKDHLSQFSHPCPKGLRCPRQSVLHRRMWTHEATLYGRPMHCIPVLPPLQSSADEQEDDASQHSPRLTPSPQPTRIPPVNQGHAQTRSRSSLL